MTTDAFIDIYWSHYLSLEKEFVNTFQYVTLDRDNENAFSLTYAKLMLAIGSELDVVLKEYCLNIDVSFKKSYKTIGKYKEAIIKEKPEFVDQKVAIINHELQIEPWKEWNNLPDAPWWWTVYNKVKHKRTSKVKIDGVEKEGYRFANQKYVMLALAGLYQILVYYYYEIAKEADDEVLTPMPASRLFKLTGGAWDKIGFYDELGFHIHDGYLMVVKSRIHY